LGLPADALTERRVPGLLATAALIGYLLIHTHVKRRRAVLLLAGVLAGAILLLIGWVAAR